jgi:hypothetical protein
MHPGDRLGRSNSHLPSNFYRHAADAEMSTCLSRRRLQVHVPPHLHGDCSTAWVELGRASASTAGQQQCAPANSKSLSRHSHNKMHVHDCATLHSTAQHSTTRWPDSPGPLHKATYLHVAPMA